MTTKLKPMGNRALVRRAQAETSKSGILLPDSAQEKPKQGEIIAVGPGKVDENGHTEPMTVQVGDTVLFSSYSGTEVKDPQNPEEECLILSEDDILGVLS